MRAISLHEEAPVQVGTVRQHAEPAAAAPTRPVTERQLDLLTAIDRLTEGRRIPPTFRELAVETGLSLQRITQLLGRLEQLGLVERDAMTARALWVTAAGRAALEVRKEGGRP